MIITRIHGGLGNQLFQYAAGHALARRLGAAHKIDPGIFSAGETRDFGLAALGLPLVVASAEEIRRLTPQWGPWWKNKFILWSHRLTPFTRRRWVKEKDFDFDPRLFHVHPPVYLDGWWQSEKYFLTVAAEIRTLFTPAQAPTPRAAEIAASLAGQETIAVHVRRGDYVHDNDASRFHGTCPPSYYDAACARLAHDLPDAKFCVFSDDPDWARANIKLPARAEFIVSRGPLATQEDFFLMTRCRHFIIANSTFSWWPAWLADAPGQRVIAPRQWFLGYEVNLSDRFPADWELLDP